ncbi:hypothetical protein LXL04_011799 [Taraxacum kok-saghyz]
MKTQTVGFALVSVFRFRFRRFFSVFRFLGSVLLTPTQSPSPSPAIATTIKRIVAATPPPSGLNHHHSSSSYTCSPILISGVDFMSISLDQVRMIKIGEKVRRNPDQSIRRANQSNSTFDKSGQQLAKSIIILSFRCSSSRFIITLKLNYRLIETKSNIKIQECKSPLFC